MGDAASRCHLQAASNLVPLLGSVMVLVGNHCGTQTGTIYGEAQEGASLVRSEGFAIGS